MAEQKTIKTWHELYCEMDAVCEVDHDEFWKLAIVEWLRCSVLRDKIRELKKIATAELSGQPTRRTGRIEACDVLLCWLDEKEKEGKE